MSAVRITCDTGDTWITSLNGTLNEARLYFMGQQFTDEADNGRETIKTVVDVQEVSE